MTPLNSVQAGFSGDELLRAFWQDCGEPSKKTIEEQGVMDVVRNLVQILERHGQCSAMPFDDCDEILMRNLSSHDSLDKITLREHSYSVALHMLKIIRDRYNDAEQHMPKALITALAHDIGRIPEYSNAGVSNTSAHQLIGARKLRELFVGHDNDWLRDAVRAVENHHSPDTKNDLTLMLKKADRCAWRLEFLSFAKGFDLKLFDAWFDTSVFIAQLLAGTNVSGENRTPWRSFTHRGVLYADSDYVYELARTMCYSKKVLDDLFMYKSDKDRALLRIIAKLRREQLIHSMMGARQHSMRFDVHAAGVLKQMTLVPIKLKAMDIEKIEARKSGVLPTISKIMPTVCRG